MTAIASMFLYVSEACSRASLTTGIRDVKCSLEAISGIMPPYFLCISDWDATILDLIIVPSVMTAAAVSSHEVSIPNTFTNRYPLILIAHHILKKNR